MRTAFINELIKLAALDKRIMLITGDLGYSVLEPFAEKFPDRYINVGIAEQNMIGIAAGLAMSGKVVFTYSIANFATLRCLEQIRDDVCYHHANVKVVSVGAGFSYGTQGYTHFGTEDIAIMRSLPNMNVFSPADPAETYLSVNQALSIDGPCYLRLGKAKEKVLHNDVALPENFPAIYPLLSQNSHKTILATGSITAAVYEYLLAHKLNYNLWSIPHIKPMDAITLLKIAKSSKIIYTVEEHQLSGGFGSAVLENYERLISQGKLDKFPLIKRIGISDLIPDYIGSQNYLRDLIDLSILNTKEDIIAVA